MYTNWKVNDRVEIGVIVAEFCGYTPQIISLFSADMELYPVPLNLQCPISGCNANTCINVSGRQVNFFSCKNYSYTQNDVNCNNITSANYTKYYRQLGTTTADNNGLASFTHIVNSQDLADYNDAISDGGNYNIIACINDTLATKAHSNNFGNITVATPPPPPPGPTHYIEYDISFLPTDFLGLVGSNVTNISDWIGNKLPLPSNVTYFYSEYTDGHFKLYVGYSGALGLSISDSSIHDTLQLEEYRYNTLEIPLSLQVLAGIIGGTIVFALMLYVLGTYAPWVLASIYGIGAVAIAAILAAVAIGWSIHDLSTGSSSSGTKTPDPYVDIKAQGDFANLTRQKCLELNPGCDTGNCSVSNLRNYNICMGAVDLAQYVTDHKVNGTYNQTDYNKLQNDIKSTDDCLGNSSCSNQTASNQISGRKNTSDTNHSQVLNQIECPGQIWNVKQQKCVPLQKCWIPGPLGTCILSADAGTSILIFGGLLIGGYVAFKLFTGHKSQELVVKAERS